MARTLNCDEATTVRSSIGLLQARFRQLQRTREMREERNLLGPLAASRTDLPNHCERPFGWFLHPELVHPSRPLSGRDRIEDCETLLSIGLRAHRADCPKMYQEAAVDTSLRL